MVEIVHIKYKPNCLLNNMFQAKRILFQQIRFFLFFLIHIDIGASKNHFHPRAANALFNKLK